MTNYNLSDFKNWLKTKGVNEKSQGFKSLFTRSEKFSIRKGKLFVLDSEISEIYSCSIVVEEFKAWKKEVDQVERER